MKKLSNKKVLALSGLAVYIIAYNAGKKDAEEGIKGELDTLARLNQKIGYMNAVKDFISDGKKDGNGGQ